MAGDWVKMRKSLLADPRVVRISSALKADRFRTIGVLFSAWCLLDEQTIDGHLEGYTEQAFDEIIGINGIAQAMQSVGWLEIGDNFVKAPMFSEHNGQTAKRRAQESVRKMSARKADKLQTKTGTREEKRREENTNKKNTKKNNQANSRFTKPDDVSEKVWSDWLAHRKAKRSVVTDLVVDQHRKAAKDRGWSLEAALVECVARGWTGLKSEWLDMKRSPVVDMTNDDWMARIPT